MSIDPFIANIFFDSCAFDGGSPEEQTLAQKLLQNKTLNIILASSTVEEINHPNTPHATKNIAKNLIRTLPVNLTVSEMQSKKKVLDILAGNGRRQNMAQDAKHLFEACRIGNYFITTDKTILNSNRRDEIHKMANSCKVMRSSEMCMQIEFFEKQNELKQQILALHTERDKHPKNSRLYKELDAQVLKLEQKFRCNTAPF